ncbi:MAG: PHB depolymerase family esterase [Thiotrichaceae bacterium]
MRIIQHLTISIFLFTFLLFYQTSYAFEKRTEKVSSAEASKFSKAQLSLEKIHHNRQERSYYLHLPNDLPHNRKPATNLPLILVLHGGGKADGDETAKHTGYNTLADKHGFIVAYPNGLNAQWNDGRGKTYRNTNNASTDDVGFISVLIDTLIRDYKADANRVYVTGLSNGGMMTLRLGCELSSKLAAIAPVIANIPQNIIGKCKPDSPLPVLIMNGTNDPLVPWNGGDVKFFRKKMGKVVSTRETVKFWVKHNQCNPVPSRRAVPNTDKTDHSKIVVTTYSCRNKNNEVVLYAVHGGGHAFPGSNTRDLPRILGRKNKDIKGADVIWKFFKRHSR